MPRRHLRIRLQLQARLGCRRWIGGRDRRLGGLGAPLRRVWGGIAAASLAASLILLAASLAAAEDQVAAPGAAREPGPTGAGASAKFLLFSGTDFWRDGAFLYGGLVWSPAGLDRDGFTLKGLIGGGTYRYNSGALSTEVDGREYMGSVMAGWRFKVDRLEATVLVGPDFQDHKLTPDDPGGRLRGSYFGGRAGLDVWYEPTPTLMAAVNTSVSTIASEYAARGAFGFRVLDRLYVGPEAETLGCVGYRVFRFGAHATGLKFGSFEWSAGGGWADDSDRRAGAYGHIGVLARY